MDLSSFRMVLMGLTLAVEAVGQTRNITVSPGETVTLPCTAPHDGDILVVEWNRTDLDSEYVLSYRDDQFDPEAVHTAFKGRADLKDSKMKTGDLSMILTNVTMADSGTYLCKAYRKEQAPQILNTINLCVSFPGPTGEKERSGANGDGKMEGSHVLIVMLLIPVVILVVGLVAGIVSYNRKKNKKKEKMTASTPCHYEIISNTPSF